MIFNFYAPTELSIIITFVTMGLEHYLILFERHRTFNRPKLIHGNRKLGSMKIVS